MPSTASTPATALLRLTELSADARAAALLGPGGELLAAEPASADVGEDLRELTLTLLEAADGGEHRPAELEITTQSGAVFLVRTEGATLAVVTGRLVLSSLMRYDMRRMLVELGEDGELR